MSGEEKAFKPNLSKAAGVKDDNQLDISEETFSTALDPNSFLCPQDSPGLLSQSWVPTAVLWMAREGLLSIFEVLHF